MMISRLPLIGAILACSLSSVLGSFVPSMSSHACAPHSSCRPVLRELRQGGARALPPRASVEEREELEYLLGPVDVGCAKAWVEQNSQLKLARLCIVAQQPPMTDEAVAEFSNAFLKDVLDLGVPFSVLWDCRSGAFPSMKQFKTVLASLDTPHTDGISTRSEVWDARVQGNAIILSNPILRGTVRLMAGISRPPQPTHVGADLDGALAFARERCQVARDWANSS